MKVYLAETQQRNQAVQLLNTEWLGCKVLLLLFSSRKSVFLKIVFFLVFRHFNIGRDLKTLVMFVCLFTHKQHFQN